MTKFPMRGGNPFTFGSIADFDSAPRFVCGNGNMGHEKGAVSDFFDTAP